MRTVSPYEFGAIFSHGMRARTLLVTVAATMHISTFYFLLKWTPKVAINLGLSPADGAAALFWVNIGGIGGATLFGFAAQRMSYELTAIIAFVLASCTVSATSFAGGDAVIFQTLLCASGFFVYAGMAAIYMLCATSFPLRMRSAGTGFAVGIGRGLAALAPVLAGWLFTLEVDLRAIVATLGCGSLGAAGILLWLKREQKARDL